MTMYMDELSDPDTDMCCHPLDRREYDGSESLTEDGQRIEWLVRCGECSEVLAQGSDPL